MIFEEMETQINRFTQAFRDWRKSEGSVENALDDLLTETDSRAVGLWRLDSESLHLVGFRAKPDMPAEVRTGFADATRQVPLFQTGLGIVKAVVKRGPAVANVEAGQAGLADSASWLAKFEAVQSLAVPIFAGEDIIGVLAMSTAHPFREHDETWQLLTGVAGRLGS